MLLSRTGTCGCFHETLLTSGPGGGRGVLHVVDLISGRCETESTGEGGVHHGEGWGGDNGIGQPGALLLSAESTKWHCNSKGWGKGGQFCGDGTTNTASSFRLWATDLCEFLSFVCSLWNNLLSVQDSGTTSDGDFLVEPVGAPPTGPGSSCCFNFESRNIPFISSDSVTGRGWACLLEHGKTQCGTSICWDSVCSSWYRQGTDEGREVCSKFAAGSLVQGGTTE